LPFTNAVKGGDDLVEEVTDRPTLDKIRELFEKTWKDRPYKGVHPVKKLKVERVMRVSNAKVQRQYADKLQRSREDAEEKKVTRQRLLSHFVDTAPLAPDLDPALNEALLFHASTEAGVEAILRSRVKVMSQGAAHGDLYGPGCYFGESVSKADTYATPRSDGLCGLVISRVVLGNIYSTSQDSPNLSDLMRKVNSGEYQSICGDRTKLTSRFGGWREFITYDEQRSMPLFLVWYRRM